MATILDGKFVSAKVKEDLTKKCSILKSKYSIIPKLAIVIVGDDPASQIYVASKERACEQVGISSISVRLPENTTQRELENNIIALAKDNSVNGVMLQLPLPKGLDTKSALECIPPEKDVDGLTTLSGGACFYSYPGFIPCTPKGIITILKEYDLDLAGKHAVVIGRSNMVGKPISMLLLNENCTVTMCHSKTPDLSVFIKQADILVVAVGKKHLITADMIKPGAIVVDVGINRENGKIYGDVDFENAKNVASYITPVPGGVGLMTVATLLLNTFEGCVKQNNLNYEL